MGTIAEVRLPADEFALHETFRARPSAEFEVQRVVAHAPDHLLPFLWATADDREGLRESLDADGSIDSVERLSSFDGEWLFRMAWVDRVRLVGHALVEQEATVLQAAGAHDEWVLRLFFPDRQALGRTHDFAVDEGLTMDVEKVYELDGSGRDRHGLTDPQHETLVRAYELGYYDFPHGVTTAELGEEFDISGQAVADRLRRGHGNLVQEALVLGNVADTDAPADE
jgi:hypothetical protein